MLAGAKQEGTSDVAYSRNQPSVLEDDREPQRQRGARSGAQHTSNPKRIADFRGSQVCDSRPPRCTGQMTPYCPTTRSTQFGEITSDRFAWLVCVRRRWVSVLEQARCRGRKEFSPTAVHEGPNTTQQQGRPRIREQDESTTYPTLRNLQNLHPRFKSGR